MSASDEPRAPSAQEIREKLRELRGPLENLVDDVDLWGAELTRALRAQDEPSEVLLNAKATFFKMQSSIYMVMTHRAALLDILKKSE